IAPAFSRALLDLAAEEVVVAVNGHRLADDDLDLGQGLVLELRQADHMLDLALFCNRVRLQVIGRLTGCGKGQSGHEKACPDGDCSRFHNGLVVWSWLTRHECQHGSLSWCGRRTALRLAWHCDEICKTRKAQRAEFVTASGAASANPSKSAMRPASAS